MNRLLGLEKFGLPQTDFICAVEGDELVGCAALWDQRSFRQTVIRGYSGLTALARPVIYLGSRLLATARPPAPGSTLAHAFLSPLAVDADRPDLLRAMVNHSLAKARDRRIDFLTLGFAAADPRLRTVEDSFNSRRYHSRLYQVFWPDEDRRTQLDGRRFFPDVALL